MAVLREYFMAIRKHYAGLIAGALVGVIGLASLRWDFKIPGWVWIVGFGFSTVWVQFAAWKDMRGARDSAVRDLDALKAKPSLDLSLDWQSDPSVMRIRITNEGPGDIPAGKVVNLIVPAAWRVEGCKPDGVIVPGAWQPQRSDEDVLTGAGNEAPEEGEKGRVPGTLLSRRLDTPIEEGLTHTLWFRVAPDTSAAPQTRLRFVVVGFAAVDWWVSVVNER
jgi:hypothetical protein